MKNNHNYQIPEHPVIWAMERFGEYPVPEQRQRPLPRWGNAIGKEICLRSAARIASPGGKLSPTGD